MRGDERTEDAKQQHQPTRSDHLAHQAPAKLPPTPEQRHPTPDSTALSAPLMTSCACASASATELTICNALSAASQGLGGGCAGR
jgi:hypothetical protein